MEAEVGIGPPDFRKHDSATICLSIGYTANRRRLRYPVAISAPQTAWALHDLYFGLQAAPLGLKRHN